MAELIEGLKGTKTGALLEKASKRVKPEEMSMFELIESMNDLAEDILRDTKGGENGQD